MSEPQRDVRQVIKDALTAKAYHSCLVGPMAGPMRSEQAILLVNALPAVDAVMDSLSSDWRQRIEQVAEAQARAVQRELDEIGIGGYPVSPHPECDSVSDALYVDTKSRLLEALGGLLVAASVAQKPGV